MLRSSYDLPEVSNSDVNRYLESAFSFLLYPGEIAKLAIGLAEYVADRQILRDLASFDLDDFEVVVSVPLPHQLGGLNYNVGRWLNVVFESDEEGEQEASFIYLGENTFFDGYSVLDLATLQSMLNSLIGEEHAVRLRIDLCQQVS